MYIIIYVYIHSFIECIFFCAIDNQAQNLGQEKKVLYCCSPPWPLNYSHCKN